VGIAPLGTITAALASWLVDHLGTVEPSRVGQTEPATT
jgi:hypothetical protein